MKTHQQNRDLWIRRPKWRLQKRRQQKRAFFSCKHRKRKRHLWISPLSRDFVVFPLVFITNLLAVHQLNIFIILLMELYHSREQRIFMDYVSSSNGLVMRRPKKYYRQPLTRRFWIKPGRTQAWWDSFGNNVVPLEEWKENFRMSRATFLCVKCWGRMLNITQPEWKIL